MIRRITVNDVLESNDCAGRKTIIITSQAEDEVVPSGFVLTPTYMFPHEKLMLATVAPDDEVEVIITDMGTFDTVVGEYISNRFDATIRTPHCRCGAEVVCDGFHLYCPNPQCFLTLAARLNRLAHNNFFSKFVSPTNYGGEEAMLFSDNPYYAQPFLLLTDPRLWGYSDQHPLRRVMGLEEILMRRDTSKLSLATFLVPYHCQEFIDGSGCAIDTDSPAYHGLNHFFRMMDGLIFKRDYQSHLQNKLIKEFLWCLGLESLTMEIIDALVLKEEETGWMEDVFLPYAYYLTHPQHLAHELGVHPLKAKALSAEVMRRKEELITIFSGYSDPEGITLAFNGE